MNNKKDIIKLIGIVSNLGFSLTILVLVGYYLGYKLDQYFQTSGLLLALSVILFFIIGFIGFLTSVLKVLK